MALELALEKSGVALLRAKVGIVMSYKVSKERGWVIGGGPMGRLTLINPPRVMPSAALKCLP